MWNELINDRIPRRSPIYPIAKARFQTINVGMFAAAYLMGDPRLPPLPVEQVHSAVEYMTAASVGNEFATFLACSGACKPLAALHRVRERATYWIAAEQIGVPAALCSFGVQFASSRASSADLERQFSRLRGIYGFRRTRLGAEKASRLCFILSWLNRGVPSWTEDEDLFID